jgi:transposase
MYRSIRHNKRTGQWYAYDCISYRDPITRKTRQKSTCIGRYNPETKEITPTDGRMKKAAERKLKFEKEPTKLNPSRKKALLPHSILNCGEPTVMLAVAKQLGLQEVLQEAFPEYWDQILLVAIYVICQGSVMSYIEDWLDSTKFEYPNFNDVKCSQLMASLSFEQRQSFFQKWVAHRNEMEHIAIDVTSISTSSNNIEIAEWGYNRDNEKIPQINHGMFVGIKTKTPVYYSTYSGSVPDKASLEYSMINAKDIGIKQATFVMDQGFVTKDNLAFMIANEFTFITVMPSSRKETKTLINAIGSSIEVAENWIDEYKLFGSKRKVKIDGFDLYVHIYFSNPRKSIEVEGIFEYFQKLESELEQLKSSKKLPKRYTDNFVIDGTTKTTFTYSRKLEVINMKLKQCGFFILFTNKSEYSSFEVIDMYRQKDIIEKHFDLFKNWLELYRLRTHNIKTTEGKIFIGFIALIIRSNMLYRLKNNEFTKKLTFEKILIELKKIRVVIMSDMSENLMTLTRTQKTILDVFNVNVDDLLCYTM